MQGVREVAGEVIDRGGGIHEQDRPVHSRCNDLPGKLEPFLPGRAKDMDMAAVILDTAEIQCNGRCPPGAVRLDMLRFGVDGLDQRGLSRPKCTKNDNFQFFSSAIR